MVAVELNTFVALTSGTRLYNILRQEQHAAPAAAYSDTHLTVAAVASATVDSTTLATKSKLHCVAKWR